MTLIPHRDPFCGPLFLHLRYEFPYLLIVHLDGPGRPEWQLDPLVQEGWQALKSFCHKAVIELFSLCCGSYLPQHFKLWWFPEQFQYIWIWPVEVSARVVAFQARNTFLPLMSVLLHMLLIV